MRRGEEGRGGSGERQRTSGHLSHIGKRTACGEEVAGWQTFLMYSAAARIRLCRRPLSRRDLQDGASEQSAWRSFISLIYMSSYIQLELLWNALSGLCNFNFVFYHPEGSLQTNIKHTEGRSKEEVCKNWPPVEFIPPYHQFTSELLPKDGSFANKSVPRNDSLTLTNWPDSTFHFSLFLSFSQTSCCAVHYLVIRGLRASQSYAECKTLLSNFSQWETGKHNNRFHKKKPFHFICSSSFSFSQSVSLGLVSECEYTHYPLLC